MPAEVFADAWYMENDLTITKGEDNVGVYVMTEGYLCHRLCCKSCFSYLALKHPAYNENVCCVDGRFIVEVDFM